MPKILKTKKVKQTKQYNPVILYLLSVLKGLVICVCGFVLLAFIFMNSGSFNIFTKIMIYLIIFAGGFVSGFCSNRKVKGRGFLDGGISSAIYSVFIFILLLILTGFNIGVNILTTILSGIAGGVLGGIVSANK